ncbi:hypothetical protein AALB_3196 [Agarivorans albus MKT 106]|uniref:Uncharacterized protein n=1 Tax=Agarivorans albus MKT 106 TaxID=1331007 RepID=R9PTW2_AGAAL|nr:hypothetical protein AALB_3196 [Agarivorans albus MKT 106]
MFKTNSMSISSKLEPISQSTHLAKQQAINPDLILSRSPSETSA